MTEPVQFHTRGEVGLSDPTNTTGTSRPLLLDNRPIHTVHYTGLIPKQIWFTGGDGIFDTIEEVYDFMERLEQVARAAGKPFEYNTTIPIMSDNSAHVVAYADEYVAAHSAGENLIAHGTLFITGVGQDLNAGAILAFQWWNAVLEATGRLIPNSQILEHNEMPDAQTACPGIPIHNRMSILRTPYAPPAPPKPVEPTKPPSNTKETLMVTVFQPNDCKAEFIGMTDANGNALEVEWIQTAKDQARRDAHIKAGARIDKGPGTRGRFVNCNLIGPIPTGDTYPWSAKDFNKIRP